MKKRLDKGLKALYFILLVCVLILVYFMIIGFIFFRKVNTPLYFYSNTDYWIAYNDLYNEVNNDIQPLSKPEYKEIIEEENDLSCYFYGEKILRDDYNGLTFGTIRLILVDERLQGFEYAVVFTHETVHLTQMIGNERYVCFETFKYLYENENEALHKAGVWYGLKQLEFKYSQEYQCEDMIIKYMLDKKYGRN